MELKEQIEFYDKLYKETKSAVVKKMAMEIQDKIWKLRVYLKENEK